MLCIISTLILCPHAFPSHYVPLYMFYVYFPCHTLNIPDTIMRPDLIHLIFELLVSTPCTLVQILSITCCLTSPSSDPCLYLIILSECYGYWYSYPFLSSYFSLHPLQSSLMPFPLLILVYPTISTYYTFYYVQNYPLLLILHLFLECVRFNFLFWNNQTWCCQTSLLGMPHDQHMFGAIPECPGM